MPEPTGPAVLSDWLFTSAVGVYTLAALLSACEYVLGRYPVRRPALVAVGAGSGGAAPTATHAPRVALPERLGRMGVALTVLGALMHVTSVTLRGVATERIPWANIPRLRRDERAAPHQRSGGNPRRTSQATTATRPTADM